MMRCCCCREENHGHPGKVPVHKKVITGVADGSVSDCLVLGSNEGYLHIGDVYVDTYKAAKDGTTSKIKQLDSYVKSQHDRIKSNEVRITIESPQGKQELFFTLLKSNKVVLYDVDGVVNVNFEMGSIVITLTMQSRYDATQQWIETLLHAIFNNILINSISEGDVFTVTVERPTGNQRNRYGFLDEEDPYNCIPKVS